MAKNTTKKPATRQVNKAAPKNESKAGRIATSELGRTGLTVYSGYIHEEILRQLQSDQKTKVYKEMSQNDSVIAAILFTVDMLIRQVSVRVEAGGPSRQDEEAAEFVETCLTDMSTSWEDTISEILSFLPYGYSLHEIVYKYRQGDSRDPSKRSQYTDGRIGWRKIPIRAQDTCNGWVFDDDGGVKGFIQQAPPTYVDTTIPIEKALLFKSKSYKGSPEGQSILHGAYISYYRKKHIEEIESIGIERDLAGYPVVYCPVEWTQSSASTDEAAAYSALKDLVRNIRRDEQEGAVLPLIFDENKNQLVKLELLSSNGKRNFNTNDVINRFDQRIAMSVLADFILLGTKEVGSYALSSSKTDMFARAIGAWLKSIAAVFNRHAIPRLINLNGFRLENYPELKFGDLETPDLGEIGEYISKLSGAGISFDDLDTQNYFREIANLPQVEEEDIHPDEDEAMPTPEQLAIEEAAEAAKDLKKVLVEVGE